MMRLEEYASSDQIHSLKLLNLAYYDEARFNYLFKLSQNSEEWLTEREITFGASEIAYVMND